MAIAKMAFLNIAAPVGRFDEIVRKYIAGYPIELENANELYKDVEGTEIFNAPNPFEAAFKVQSDVIELTQINVDNIVLDKDFETLSVEEAVERLSEIREKINYFDNKVTELENQLNESGIIRSQLEPVKGMEANLDELFNLKYLRFRFGRLPRESFEKLEKYLNDLDAIYLNVHETKEYVWVIYFTPQELHDKIDDIFTSLYFERIWISDKAYGIPEKAFMFFDHLYANLLEQKEEIIKEKQEYVNNCTSFVSNMYRIISSLYRAFELRKLALRTEEFFYICGWIPESELVKIKKSLDLESDIAYTVSYEREEIQLEPPVHLENKGVFKAFEWLVNMYSLPNYSEFDPTKLFTITYIFTFAIMFGDVGNGAVLALAGLFIHFKKRSPLGMIMVPLGIASIFTGFLYGSVFGYEELIPTLLIKPLHSASTINQMLYSTVGIGAVLILTAMICNIINGVKQKDVGRIWFDQNGVAGFIMYGSIFVGIIAKLKGISLFSIWYILLFIVIPLIIIFFKEPITSLVTKKKGHKFNVAENSFEFFEILLSFATNTLSFVRIGAFALNHAGMLSVVFVIANMFSGAGSIITIALGNLIVMVLEGLVVGIQVLRLEFFEMFSRYYTGGGKKFTPLKVEKIKM